MGRSLSLAAYRVLSRRRSSPSPAFSRARPMGEVLWLHATSDDRLVALAGLGVRLKSLRPELNLLITRDPVSEQDRQSRSRNAHPGAIEAEVLDTDHPIAALQFVDHWRPDVCIWAGGELMPNLISTAADQGVAMILVDVNTDDFPARRHKWFPDLTRSSLDRFDDIMTASQGAAAILQRIGVPARDITVTERLRNGASPQPFAEEELSTVAQNLAGRPVWLAALAQPAEFDAILAAHRAALRFVHRLLLVLIVAEPDDVNVLATQLDGSGLRFARWSLGDHIDDNTQVLITDGTEDLGLWYRAAPLTLMASSLTAGSTGRDPLEAAALGSAVLFGPYVQDHLDAYSRLIDAGAGRTVGDVESLGAAVIRLVAPDHAAAMALAGWEVATEGAQLIDTLVDLVQDKLDAREAGHARP